MRLCPDRRSRGSGWGWGLPSPETLLVAAAGASKTRFLPGRVKPLAQPPPAPLHRAALGGRGGWSLLAPPVEGRGERVTWEGWGASGSWPRPPPRPTLIFSSSSRNHLEVPRDPPDSRAGHLCSLGGVAGGPSGKIGPGGQSERPAVCVLWPRELLLVRQGTPAAGLPLAAAGRAQGWGPRLGMGEEGRGRP